MRTVVLSLCCVLLFCGSLWAQATGQIAGTVRDESGAVIPGAEIKVTQTATGAVRSTLSGEDGRYVLPTLPLGPYMLEVSQPGFTTYIETGIVLPGATTNAVRATVRGNVFKGLGAALSETSAGVDIDVERNMFESVTSKVTIASGSRLRVLGVSAASAPPNTCTAARTGERYFDLDQF